MGAPKGNNFWEIRSKHGRSKLFKSPKLMWDAACEYFQWAKDNPWYRSDIKGKFNEEVEIPIERPLTLKALCLYLDCNEAYFRTFKSQLPKGEKGFNTVIKNIEDTIYTQKFEGAAVGLYNSNIIARDLGLTEKTISENINYNTDITKEEAKAISDALEDEV